MESMPTNEHSEGHQHTGGRKFYGSTSKWVFIGFSLIAAFLLITEHRAHLIGFVPYLPFLFLLACPFMHFFHHGGHGGHSHGDHVSPESSNESTKEKQ